MKEQVRLQIEMAAKGCINGPLSEWPQLKNALSSLGYDLPDCTTPMTLTSLCRKLLSNES